MNLRWLIATAIVFSALAVSAEESDRDEQFNLLDVNNDGFLTKSEISSVKELASRFNSLDTNKDDRIERAEFARLDSSEAFTPVEGENEPIGAAPTD